MPVKKKFPPAPHKRVTRPDAEQLALLEKAIYHSYKMTFVEDPGGNSNLLSDGIPVKGAKTVKVDLNDFFKLIVKTYSTL